MWFEYKKLDGLSCAYAESLGRALALAQSFEKNCKFVLLIANVSKEIEENRIANLEQIKSYSERLNELFKLGNAVNLFEFRHKIKLSDIEVLKKGKDARNYIAHEAAHSLLLEERSGLEIQKEMTMYQSKLLALAEAENLISKWSYEIQEKTVPPNIYSSTYVTRVYNWIMEPLLLISAS